MGQIQMSHKGAHYIDIKLMAPWLGHKPIYTDETEKDVDLEKTRTMPITYLQARKMIERGQAIAVDEIKPGQTKKQSPIYKETKAKRGRPPGNKMIEGVANK